MNLKDETMHEVREAGKSPAQILYVTSGSGSCSWTEFLEIADINYDEGYGGQEIRASLCVVFSDGSWLSRGEYDGSEWWDYQKCPQRHPKFLTQDALRERCL